MNTAPADDSNSSGSDMFEGFTNDNRNSKNSMEESSETLNSGANEVIRETPSASGTSRKIKFQPPPQIPKVAVQEKIVLCIENSEEKGLVYMFSESDEESKEPNINAIRNEVLRIMMINKLALAKDTEFAIALVEPANELKWLSPLTSNLSRLSNSLKDYKCVINGESNKFDITSIFREVLMKIHIPENNNVTIIPPSYIIRIIFVYNSSHLIPHVNTKDPSYVKFMMSPYCFLDIFYLHEKQSDFNNVERIYQEFGNIVSPTSYLLESSRDVTKVFNNAVKLLANPNQRVSETVWNF